MMRHIPYRIDIFADVPFMPKRRRWPVIRAVAWQDWNDSPKMESWMARRPGSGSFYWPTARAAWRRACVMLGRDDRIRQIKVETISGREVGRVYRKEVAV